jgi:hypothetical protein
MCDIEYFGRVESESSPSRVRVESGGPMTPRSLSEMQDKGFGPAVPARPDRVDRLTRPGPLDHRRVLCSKVRVAGSGCRQVGRVTGTVDWLSRPLALADL